MDHGRIVPLYLMSLSPDKLKYTKITIYDIDQETIDWWKSIIPPFLIEIGVFKIIPKDVTSLKQPQPNTIRYYNFCGISNSLIKLNESFSKFTGDQIGPVLVTWATRKAPPVATVLS